MMVAPVLDTHVWIWWMLGDSNLSQNERDALDAFPAEFRPILSDISLWEFATLVDMGRLEIEGSVTDWLRIAASPATVKIQSITPAIVAEMNRLPASFHRDPADRLIVATARCLKLPLATKDRKIRGSRLVSIWKP
jgi:PIN domain nuclease of toxin-antitoxin system